MSGRSRFVSVVIFLFVFVSGPLDFVLGASNCLAADKSAKGPENSTAGQPDQKPAAAVPGPEENLSVTSHTLKLAGGESLRYTATAGCLRLKDESGKPTADIFFIAYSAEDQSKVRPVTFAFNGGPGASSVWLHMGVAGPVHVTRGKTGSASQSGPNANSWLAWTDLVFIDPVGTGFSRAVPPENAKQFYNGKADIHSVGDFIQLYAGRFGRWLSPKCLAGESYGGMRAAGLLPYLYETYGMEIDGLILISPALDLHAIQPGPPNDLPYMLFLPSYAATAWYHKKIDPDRRSSLADVLSEAETWGMDQYLPMLARGDRISAQDKDRVASRLSGFTGLSEQHIRNRNLRISRPRIHRRTSQTGGAGAWFHGWENGAFGK